MAGIYIHIPFCRKACHYCSFHFSTSPKLIDPLVSMLVKEINTRKESASSDVIESIYLGGGTPSMLAKSDLSTIFEAINENYTVAEGAEITLEANPEDITSEIIQHWEAIGINRLSIGIQSFADKDLSFMNRNHDQGTSHKALELAFQSNINNISGDLMFGLIGNSLDDWSKNLERMVNYPFTHLSVYNLTIEEQTVFHHWQKESKINESASGLQEEQFKLATVFLNERGFDHYEISNYAKPGFQAVHNTNYWKGVKYLGFGPSAHSYDGIQRSWNITNNKKYIDQWKNGKVDREHETLDAFDRLNETIMLGIRTKWGIEKQLLSKLPEIIQSQFREQLFPFIEKGTILDQKNAYILPKEFWYLSDTIASDLFITKE